jgi:hypothetical protein
MRARNQPPRQPEHVADQPGELDVGALQHLDEPVALRGLGLDQRAAVPREVAQVTKGLVRDEAFAHQAVAHQHGQPFGILDVGLAPRHRLDVLGVGDDQLEAALGFQHRVDGPPVDAGGSHAASDARPAAVVGKVAYSLRGRARPSCAMSAQATIVALCTSSPAQRAATTSMLPLRGCGPWWKGA